MRKKQLCSIRICICLSSFFWMCVYCISFCCIILFVHKYFSFLETFKNANDVMAFLLYILPYCILRRFKRDNQQQQYQTGTMTWIEILYGGKKIAIQSISIYIRHTHCNRFYPLEKYFDICQRCNNIERYNKYTYSYVYEDHDELIAYVTCR